MTDVDALDTIADVCALRGGTEVESLGIERLRAAHALMVELMPLIEGVVNDADQKELDDARKRVAELEARLFIAPEPRKLEVRTMLPDVPEQPRAHARILSDYEQTDAGMGIGGGREPEQGAEDFRDELAELRERSRARRPRGIS